MGSEYLNLSPWNENGFEYCHKASCSCGASRTQFDLCQGFFILTVTNPCSSSPLSPSRQNPPTNRHDAVVSELWLRTNVHVPGSRQNRPLRRREKNLRQASRHSSPLPPPNSAPSRRWLGPRQGHTPSTIMPSPNSFSSLFLSLVLFCSAASGKRVLWHWYRSRQYDGNWVCG